MAKKRLQVVTEKTPWSRGMSGVNSFGFGGANAHALLKDVARPKVSFCRGADYPEGYVRSALMSITYVGHAYEYKYIMFNIAPYCNAVVYEA